MGNLTRLTVNLTSRTSGALDDAIRATGDSKTDTINRAIQVYALLAKEAKKGSKACIIDKKGNMEVLVIL